MPLPGLHLQALKRALCVCRSGPGQVGPARALCYPKPAALCQSTDMLVLLCASARPCLVLCVGAPCVNPPHPPLRTESGKAKDIARRNAGDGSGGEACELLAKECGPKPKL